MIRIITKDDKKYEVDLRFLKHSELIESVTNGKYKTFENDLFKNA